MRDTEIPRRQLLLLGFLCEGGLAVLAWGLGWLTNHLPWETLHWQPRDAFAMATAAGAKVLGRESELGRLAPGYLADFVVFDFRRAHLTPLIDPLTPNMAKPPRSSVTLSESILIPLLPLTPTILLETQYEPGWLITNSAVASPGVLTLLTSIHVACAAQVKSHMKPITTEPIHDFFITWYIIDGKTCIFKFRMFF